MELERPRFVSREEVFARRPQRAEGIRFAGLWLAGSLTGLGRKTVAVVGMRAPSDAARSRAHRLGGELGRAGICVISGLALGIDGSAHAGALSAGGVSLGILGGGHRHFFPRGNVELARSLIAAGGAVLSPYPPDEPARPPQFLQRNGVVAALADAVVVVEAAERSGALNTAGWAAALGIDVMAYPGDVDRPKAAGCNALIRDGAILVRGPDDVLAVLGIAVARAQPERESEDPREAAVARLLALGPHSLDELLERTGAAPGELFAALVRLEFAGLVERRAGNAYASVRAAVSVRRPPALRSESQRDAERETE